MGKRQLEEGKATEERVAKLFQKNNYWAYIIPKKIGGQPFDIIACKNDITYFIDAKHLDETSTTFPFSRIEPNQKTSMRYAYSFSGIKNVGFIILWERFPEKLFFLPYEEYLELEKQKAISVKIKDLKEFVL